MRKFIRAVCVGLLIAALLPSVEAQLGNRRGQGDGVNRAPEPEVYAVLSIDADNRTIRLRAADGRTGDVQVGEGVYDLAKLKAGDKVKVDFVADEKEGPLRAASVWPVK